MEQSSQDADHSVGQIPNLSSNQKDHYCVHKPASDLHPERAEPNPTSYTPFLNYCNVILSAVTGTELGLCIDEQNIVSSQKSSLGNG